MFYKNITLNLKWNKKFRYVTKHVYHFWKAWTIGTGVGWGLTEVNKRLFKDTKKQAIANLVGYCFCVPFLVLQSKKETKLLELDLADFDADLEIHEYSVHGDDEN